MLEKPKVLYIHLFSKILNLAHLYLNAIGIFWRKFDSKIFKNDQGGYLTVRCGQDMDRALQTGHFFTLHINELKCILIRIK